MLNNFKLAPFHLGVIPFTVYHFHYLVSRGKEELRLHFTCAATSMQCTSLTIQSSLYFTSPVSPPAHTLILILVCLNFMTD